MSAQDEEVSKAKKAIQENFPQFQKLKQSVSVDPTRQQFFQHIDMAFMVQQDLENMIHQGSQFYSRLVEHLTVLKQNIQDYKMSRQIQMEQLCVQLGAPAPDFNNDNPNQGLKQQFENMNVNDPQMDFNYDFDEPK